MSYPSHHSVLKKESWKTSKASKYLEQSGMLAQNKLSISVDRLRRQKTLGASKSYFSGMGECERQCTSCSPL